MQVTHVTQAT